VGRDQLLVFSELNNAFTLGFSYNDRNDGGSVNHNFVHDLEDSPIDKIISKQIIAHLKKPHIFTMLGGKWAGKMEVSPVDAEIGV